MKTKIVGLRGLTIHMAVLAGFSLMQGCATNKGVQDEPVILPPGPEITEMGMVPPPSVNLPPAAPINTSAKSHTVKKGDTLSSIAVSYKISWKELADVNGITNPNQLKVGQELRIPSSASAVRSAAPAKRAPKKLVSSRPLPGPIKQGSSYTVQKGDSLSSIAKRSGVTVNEIKTANSMNNDSLASGKKLSIPKKGEAKAVASSKSAPAKESKPAPAKSVASTPATPVAVAAVPAPAPLMESAPAPTTFVDPNLVPADAPVSVVPAALPVETSASAPVYEHVLYPGETLEDVARQYGSSQQEIMKLNNITDPASVKAGTKLLVPIPE